MSEEFSDGSVRCTVCVELDDNSKYEEHLGEGALGGLDWVCKFVARPSTTDVVTTTPPIVSTFAAWKFEWDAQEMAKRGIERFTGVVVAKHSKTSYSNSVSVPVEVRPESGEWLEARIGPLTDFGGADFKITVEFALDPIPLLDTIREPSQLTDTVLLVEERKIHVNKSILAWHSEFFRAMFNGDFKEASMKEIRIDDVKSDDFIRLLALLHLKPSVLNERTAPKLLHLADRFIMSGIISHLERCLMASTEIPKQNLILMAEQYKLDKLFQKHLNLLHLPAEIKKITMTPEYQKLSEKTQIRLLERLLPSTVPASPPTKRRCGSGCLGHVVRDSSDDSDY